jgi:hypothetical protein
MRRMKFSFRYHRKYLIFLICLTIIFVNGYLIYVSPQTEFNSTPHFNSKFISNFKNKTFSSNDEYRNYNDKNRLKMSSEELKKFILTHNANAKIKNKHYIVNLLNDPLLFQEQNETTYKNLNHHKEAQFFVILIQIHSRISYLKELIGSLRETRYIQDALVIFSHDLYDEEMNTLINNIEFCAVS